MFIDLDTSKEFRFGAIFYHLKEYLAIRDYLIRKVVKLILFLSWLLNLVKT